MKILTKLIILVTLLVLTLSRKIKTVSKTKNSDRALEILRQNIETLGGQNDVCGHSAQFVVNLIAQNGRTTPLFNPLDTRYTNQRATQIRNLLNDGELVYIRITHDHHFILLRDTTPDVDRVYIWQSFAGAYTLNQWLTTAQNAGAYLTMQQVTTHFDTLFTTNRGDNARDLAVDALFCPPEIQTAFPDARQAIHEWFNDRQQIGLDTIHHAALDLTRQNSIFMKMWDSIKKTCLFKVFRGGK